MEPLSLFVVILSLPIIYALYYYLSTPRNLPPGPIGLPYVGYYPEPLRAHEIFIEKSKKYGPVWSYYRFGQLMITINNLESFNELIIRQGDKIMSRPNGYIQREYREYGVLNNNGNHWKVHRRFSLSTWRNFGVGKPLAEQSIHSETEFLVQALREWNGKCVNIQNFLSNAVANIICQIIMGRRYEYSDKKFWDIINLVSKLVVGVHPVTLAGVPEWLLHVAVRIGGNRIKKAHEYNLKLHEFMRNYIAEHKDAYDPADEPTDYIQAYIQEQIKGTPLFDDVQLFMAMNNMFAAGMDTTANTIRWGILFNILNPTVQEKVHQEIVEVCGKDSFPTVRDKPNLPYTEATILEIQRMASTVAITLRETSDELWHKGMFIPKGAAVLINVWGIHMDPSVFEDPERFFPERFLDSKSGKIDKRKADLIVPFGAGKRICLGEGLAKMELFLFFAALIQQFKFRVPPDRPAPSTKPNVGIVSQADPFEVLVEIRS